MNIRYRVDLTAEERKELKQMLSAGKCAARKLKRIRSHQELARAQRLCYNV